VKTNRALLEAALVGYQAQLASIQQTIQEIRKQLGQKVAATASASTTAQPATRAKRRLSAAARKRIALAQRKRWAEYNRKKASSQE
jgi:hypothetical protein